MKLIIRFLSFFDNNRMIYNNTFIVKLFYKMFIACVMYQSICL